VCSENCQRLGGGRRASRSRIAATVITPADRHPKTIAPADATRGQPRDGLAEGIVLIGTEHILRFAVCLPVPTSTSCGYIIEKKLVAGPPGQPRERGGARARARGRCVCVCVDDSAHTDIHTR